MDSMCRLVKEGAAKLVGTGMEREALMRIGPNSFAPSPG